METTLFAVVLCGLGFSAIASASAIPPASFDDYRKIAIAEASRAASEREAIHMKAESVSVELRRKIGLDRFFKVGDSWVVAVSHVSFGLVHAANDAVARRDVFLAPIFYRFTVAAVETDGKADVEVVRVDEKGNTMENERVQKLVFSVGRNFQTMRKDYFYSDRAAPITAEYTSDHGVPMGFDSFPVELPDFGHSRELEVSLTGPASGLPKTLTALIPQGLTGANTVRFESPDLLARRIRTTWRRGDLWPTIVESPAGTAVLVHQEKQQ